MAKYAAKGTTIAYLVGSTYTDIDQIDNIQFDPGGAPDKVDVTTLDSPGPQREYVTTWITPNDVQIGGPYDPANATHNWLRTNAGTEKTFKITFPDSGNATEIFSSALGGMVIGADKDGALIFTQNLAILGASAHAQ